MSTERLTNEEVQEQLADYLNLLESVETVEEARQYLRGGHDDRWENEYLGRVLLDASISPNMYIPPLLEKGIKMTYLGHFRLSLLSWVLEDLRLEPIPNIKIN